MLDEPGRALRAELAEVMGRGALEPLPDAEFDRLARRIFAYQFERNAPYAAYCRRRVRTPAAVQHWTEIPAVPSAAFKEVALVSGAVEQAEIVFRTSGTTTGRERRGQHYLLDLSLYHAALLQSITAYLFPDGATLPILSLVPSAAQMPDSSLAHMISVVMERIGAPGSGYYADVNGGIDTDALADALRVAEREERAVCLVGTALAFVHWIDQLRARGEEFYLPAGSRLMDTGGFKGRSREIDEAELRATYAATLGIPDAYCVNEYGMTELCSQCYDTVLRAAVRGADAAAASRRKAPPPWVRVQVVSPETLEPVPADETGILRVHDLANLGSVLAVQTEDLGRAVDGGFLVLGRALDTPPRGCSIAMDVLLAAVRARA